ELVRRAWASRRQRREHPGYRSRFGGLWTDRLDARWMLEERRATGEISGEDAGRLGFWLEHGFWIEKDAVQLGVTEGARAELAALAHDRDDPPRVELAGRTTRLRPGLEREHVKLVDAYARSRAALEAAFSPAIRRFLALLFDDGARLFQSLS